jgi:thiosulfate reductase cytochrome b subunit
MKKEKDLDIIYKKNTHKLNHKIISLLFTGITLTYSMQNSTFQRFTEKLTPTITNSIKQSNSLEDSINKIYNSSTDTANITQTTYNSNLKIYGNNQKALGT